MASPANVAWSRSALSFPDLQPVTGDSHAACKTHALAAWLPTNERILLLSGCAGDKIMLCLSRQLNIQYALFLTDVPGVLTQPPGNIDITVLCFSDVLKFI